MELKDIELQIQSHVKEDMEALQKLIKLYDGMKGAYTRQRAIKLYEALGRTLVVIDKTI